MGQVDGNLVQNAWSCYASYSQSTNDTTSTISITAGMRSHGYGMSLNGFWVGIDQGGYSRSSTDTSFYSATGGWVDKDLLTYADTWTRTHEDRTINCWAAIDRSDAGYRPGKSTAWMTFTVPAKDHWTIAYDANGGSGAPGSQTKWRDESLELSSTKPTRTGYTFQGWAMSSSGSVSYQPGASYTSNSGVTLYAIWKANTWTVKFDANGGNGAPAAQTKTYGIDLTLSTTKPTRALYNFLGWATSANGAVAYASGAKYTANADITLYAVWELAWIAPKLSNQDCFRCNQNGVVDDIGTYCRLVGDWVTDRTVKSIIATVNGVATTISGSGKSGSIAVTLGSGALSAETQYTVKLVITDEIGSGEWNWTIAATHYILDFAPNGSVGIGTPADSSNRRFNSDLINTTSSLWIVNGVGYTMDPTDNSGYYCFLTITVIKPYANNSLTFKIAQRNRDLSELHIRFASGEFTSPALETFYVVATSSAVGPFMYTYSNGVLKIYAGLSEQADRVGVVDALYDVFHTEGGVFPFKIDYSVTYHKALPDGAAPISIKQGAFYPGLGLTLSNGTLNARGSKLLWAADGSAGSSVDIGSIGGFMKSSQIATLAEPISKQPNGIVLLWSFYDYDTGEGTTYYRNYCFVEKNTLDYGNGVAMMLGALAGEWIAVKYMYFTDNTVTGNDANANNYPNVCSVNWYNRNFVLLKIYGV